MDDNQITLKESVECLYQTFENYTLRSHIDACDHCVDENDRQKIRSKPLRELSPNDLYRFANDAVILFGDAYDFRHFLPRLFEILQEPARDWVEPETLMYKLTSADWLHWPEAEQVAVLNFLSALWADGLGDYHSYWDAETLLATIAQAVEDMTPFLNFWIETESLCYRQHLTTFLQAQLDDINFVMKHRRLSVSARGTRIEQERQVIQWLEASSTFEKLETSFFNCKTGAVADETLKVLDLLSTLTHYLR